MIGFKVNKVSRILAVFIFIAAISACSAIFEEDITDENIEIISPSDGQVLSSNEVTISWNEIDDAVSYEVKIVSPDFTAASPLELLDTVVSEASLTLLFDDGAYAVSVKAVNSSSETETSSVQFSIAGSGLFMNQQVEVTSPEEDVFLSSGTVSFEWAQLTGADDYTLRVYENNNGITESLIFAQTTAELDLVYILNEGEYFLDITAFNGSEVTFISRIAFGVDLTSPSFPVLGSPDSDDFFSSQEIPFTWSSGQDALSEVVDSLFIYSLNSGDLLLIEEVSSPYTMPAQSLNADEYEWGIKTIDEAGNWAESEYNIFIVNE